MGLKLYPVFAETARKHGVEDAVHSFSEDLPSEQMKKFREQFLADKATVEAGGPTIITAGGDDWHSGPGEKDKFWLALRKRFEDDGWDDTRVEDVDHASSTGVAHTPRPNRQVWNSKYLVVGYVQSGKTTNFTAVAAKVADVIWTWHRRATPGRAMNNL